MTLDDRIMIQAGIAAGQTDAEIARTLGVHRGTVGRELLRNRRPSDVGPANRRRGYNALKAQERADEQRQRPKPRKLDVNPVLHEDVQKMLDQHWSPEQIANRLCLLHGKDPDMTISHEAIYQALYVNSAGGLKRELKATLRTGRTLRKPRRQAARRATRIKDMTPIVDRPEEALGRAVPGHWEGDLITGELNKTAVGTLVDRCSRYMMLLHLPDGHGAEQVRDEMITAIQRMPERLRQTVAWDQGIEMARHLDITATTGVRSTSATRTAPGNDPPTRTPTACYGVPTQRQRPVDLHPRRTRRDRRPDEQPAPKSPRLAHTNRVPHQGPRTRHHCCADRLNPPGVSLHLRHTAEGRAPRLATSPRRPQP